MTNEERKELKETFTRLERVLSSDSSVESLFKNNPDFQNVFAKAYKCLGILENEWVLKTPAAFDSREAINNVVERIEVIQYYVTQGLKLPEGNSLPDRLNDAKAILAEVNRYLNDK